MALSIPKINEDWDNTRAAFAYAAAGWYVVPVEARSKAPTVLGKRWQEQSTRDPDLIAAYFAGTDHAIGLHAGRSGAVIFDVDRPDALPEPLAIAIRETQGPFQSTRTNNPGQGHYPFIPSRPLGNGRGKLVHPLEGKAWGEVRGANGIIVAEPSEHSKADLGGRYAWLRHGEVPALPDYIEALLPEAGKVFDAASDDRVETFLRKYAAGDATGAKLRTIMKAFAEECEQSSRHEALVSAGAWAMREAMMGYFPAQAAYDMLRREFLAVMAGERGRNPSEEFKGVMAWAIGQAETIDAKAERAKIEARLAEKQAGLDDVMVDPLSGEIVGPAPAKDVFEAEDAAPEPVAVRDSSKYFPYDAETRKSDLNPILLANDVFRLGALGRGRDHRFWSYADGVWREDEHVVENRCIRLLGRRIKLNHVSLTERVIFHHRDLYQLEGEPTEDFINFRNGMLDWRTGELLSHDPSYLSTVQIPLEWDPDAQCKAFEEWLESILHPDYVTLIWQMIGYLLMSGNPLQVAFLFLGKGRNGKGTLMRVLGNLLGEENISAISLDDLSGNRFAAAGLYGKLANLAGDIDATFQSSTAKFKSLTGEDLFSAENKGQPAFRFKNWAVPVFSANKIPGSNDTSEGYLRRWVVVKFDRYISEDDVVLHLDETFLGELPGIAARGVRALRSLMMQKHFKNDGAVAQGKAEFVDALDQVRQWAEECCERVEDNFEVRTVAYDSYKWWAEKNGAGKLSAANFYERLENAGFKAVKRGAAGGRGFLGLRVVAYRMKDSGVAAE